MTLLLAMFLSGVILYVIGSVMERHEIAERERRWRETRETWQSRH
jgi:hypothetical protein